jgi:acyl carrier protein
LTSDRDGLVWRVTQIFTGKLHVEVPTPETDLIEAGILDSLVFIDLLAQLELEFGVRIELEDLEIEQFRSIERIADHVAHRNVG